MRRRATMTDMADPVEETYAERARIADLLAGLSPQQWSADSLCAGWRIREVVAHMTSPFHTRPAKMLWGMVRAGFSYDRYAARAAHADTAKRADEELLAILRRNIRTPWQPPGAGAAGALSHDVIHGLDITEPLGLPRPPAVRTGLVLQHTTPQSLAYFGADWGPYCLTSSDSPGVVGEGEKVELPSAEIVLIISGRRRITDLLGKEQR